MRKHLLLLLTALCLAGGMNAQEVIIGTGTSSDYDIAFYPYYMDSYWESLYLPAEIGMAGLITSVALQTGAGPALTADNAYIYMGTRSTTLYSSTTDWTPIGNLTLVYSGTNVALGGSNGWESYTLQTPFMYDGSSTLVIVFAKHASDYSIDASYYYHSTDNYSSLYKYMDEDPSYAQYSASSTGSRAFYRPNTKLTLTPDSNYCGAVGNIQVSGITTDAATISWNTPFNPHSYIVEVKTAAQNWNDPGVMTFTTNDTFYTVTGLNASTVYTVRIANDCVTDTSNYTTAVFNTQCGPMSALPLVENFDLYTHTDNDLSGANNLPNCWDYLNTGTSSPAAPYVYYNTSNANSGSYSVRFYTGSGSGYSDQYAFLPTLDLNSVSIPSLSLGLSIRRQGNSGTFRLVVGVTEGMDLSTFTVIDTLTSTSGTYAYHEVPLSGYSGNGNRIVLKAP
ncbi:MAG: fibronectin type III domain-containing protein, partial [Bacteroidales bacterium]|nr:fibronectin type III domain-containing protein [Bacteroidales bacterium]